MRSTNSRSRLVVTVLKRSAGALIALIGGLVIVGIGVFILRLLDNPDIRSYPVQALVLIFFAFFFAAPIWLLSYLPCHLLIPRKSAALADALHQGRWRERRRTGRNSPGLPGDTF